MNKANYRIPAYLLVMMNILGFLLIYMVNDCQLNVLYVGMGLMALFIIMYAVLVLCRMGDKFPILIVSMLITIGVLMLCRINIDKGIRQIVWIGIGGAVFFVMYVVYYNVKFWSKLWLFYAATGVGLLVMTRLFGDVTNGARNWISIGSVSFQPSEFVKVVYVLFLACYYSKSWEKPFFRVPPMYVTAIVTAVYAAFLAWQSDWGTILVLMTIYLFMMYVYEERRWFVLLCVIGGILLAFVAYQIPYIEGRVNAWLDPWAYKQDEGYQVVQSFYGIASGGYFGKGIGNGELGFIPEVATDFIFSAICGEMGVFGGAAVILLFFLLSYRCFKITLSTTNPYNKAVALGISLMFSFQTFIIIGGVINLIPLTGITVPFVSYGGTSVIVSFAALGIIQAISAIEERGAGDIEGE